MIDFLIKIHRYIKIIIHLIIIYLIINFLLFIMIDFLIKIHRYIKIIIHLIIIYLIIIQFLKNFKKFIFIKNFEYLIL